MKPEVDYRLYVVTSGMDRRTVDVAAAAARGGAGLVQVRAKDISTRELLGLSRSVAEAVASVNPRTCVLIDDSVEVTFALMRAGVPVRGVHLGQDDLPVDVAREILGQDAIIGLTTGTLELVQAAEQQADLLDYIGCGPFRPTPTKDSGRPPLGLDGYPPIVAATRLPVVAIGDVQPADVADLAQTGIAGVCMVRAIMTADDPEAVVLRALSDWDNARRPIK